MHTIENEIGGPYVCVDVPPRSAVAPSKADDKPAQPAVAPRGRGFAPTHDPNTDQRLTDSEIMVAHCLHDSATPIIRAEIRLRTGMTPATINRALTGLLRRGMLHRSTVNGRVAFALVESAVVMPDSEAWNNEVRREYAASPRARRFGPSYIGAGL